MEGEDESENKDRKNWNYRVKNLHFCMAHCPWKMEKELTLSNLVHLHCAGQEYKFGFFRTALLNSPHLDKTTIPLSVQTVAVQCQGGDFCLVGRCLQYELQDVLVTYLVTTRRALNILPQLHMIIHSVCL